MSAEEWDELTDAIVSIPAVDAVEVVRCKNCKWAVFTSEGKPYGCSYLLSEKGSIYSVNGDFYCAYGARMDGRREDGDASERVDTP
jgi:hypothetical protein